MAGGTETISSLIQGISQQAALSRGNASAEDQVNCLNEVLDGVVSRMGSIVITDIDTDYAEPYIHEINRSSGERYIVLVEGGAIRIFNKVTGNEAAITGSIAAYLAHTGDARKAFQAVTVGDTTFLLNRQVVTEMDTTLSTARPNKAIAHFKAGGYKITYKLTITISAVEYSISFTTPDNSSPGNAEYITTDYLAEQFRLAAVATLIPALNAATHTGFTVTRYGSTLVVFGAGHTFDISTTDGVGDKQFLSFKDNVKVLTDLPTKCENGYQVSVAGDGSVESSKYFLEYQGAVNTGRWVEVVAPATPIEIKASKMPHLLTNTAVDTFTVAAANWGDRLAGDGDLTAQDPSFIGERLNSLQFIGGRLGMVSEYNASISRSRNAYVFFPDTVQTNLDTAPVDYDVSNGSSTAISHAVVAGGKLQFWGEEQQTYLDSGQDPIRENTTEVLPMANYEFDGEVAPKAVGLGALVFGTAVGRWCKAVEVYFRSGRPDGEIEITAHVPKLLMGSLRHIAAGEATKKSFFLTSGANNLAYLYQWYNQGNERVQSAWNPWSFPAPTRVLWASVQGSKAYFLFRWPSGCTLEYVILDRHGDEADAAFPLRLDHRLSEADASYSSGKFTLALPFAVPLAKRAPFVCVERSDEEDVMLRGREVPFTWASDTSIEIASDNDDLEFFFGAIPTARRKCSRFNAKDREDQPILHDKLLIKSITVGHEDTVEYSVVVTSWGAEQAAQTFRSRVLGDPTIVNNQVPIKTGSFKADVGEDTENVEIELVNDTYFPAVWTNMKYAFDLTVRDGA